MTATEAKFDGAKGMRVPALGPNYKYKFLRGKKQPREYPKQDFLEQLVWVYPDNDEAKLYWCNEDDQWFELQFHPVNKP